MPAVQVIDTFPAYLTYRTAADGNEIEVQIKQWHSDYLVTWPELRQKVIDDYAGQDMHWRQIAGERVFPFLDDRLPAMKAAHDGLLKSCPALVELAQERLDFDAEIIVVIYVGLGNGAGWVTEYTGKLAILFGLENIAECQYGSQPTLSGLIAHEIGHLAHFHWRKQNDLSYGAGPWWQLYSEGFAQRCEHIILDQEFWHMKVTSSDDNWLSWCDENKAWLAAEYLRTVEEGEAANPFFGSWYNIQERTQTGYYLGHEVIREMEKEIPFTEIALIDSHDFGMRSVLKQFANREG